MKVINSYHNHTARCHHASGTDEEYVLAAIEAGYKTFGFSDHAPHAYKGEYVSRTRMLPSQLEEYVSSIMSLKGKYRKKIDIRIGLEAEYMPLLHESDLQMYRAAGVEYLILGQHSVGNESFEGIQDSFTATCDADALVRHTDQCIEGLRTGHYSCIAHPDVFHYVGDDSLLIKQYERLLGAAIDADVPVELNLLGLSGGRHYPNRLFWELAGEMKARAVLGMDAHVPARVGSPVEIRQALAFAEQYGICLEEEIPLRKL
jgi:histidinol-phosphatase (PHP family)